MTALLWSAIALTAVIAVTAFALVLALAGRVRQLADRLANHPGSFDVELPQPGDPVPDFRITATDGTSVDAGDLATDENVLLAFLTTDCDSCREVARSMASGGGTATPTASRSIAFVIGPDEQRRDMVADLEPAMSVVEQTDHNGIAARFGVRAFPAVLLASGGTIRAAGHQLEDVGAGRPA